METYKSFFLDNYISIDNIYENSNHLSKIYFRWNKPVIRINWILESSKEVWIIFKKKELRKDNKTCFHCFRSFFRVSYIFEVNFYSATLNL